MSVTLIILIVITLIGFSAICSGLNVALTSLDLTEMQRRAKNGDWRAKRVLPLRRNSHLSLASILLTNVAVISASSLVLDQWLSGLLAGIVSTLLIVVFGEVVPQAIFLRFALTVTALLAPLLSLMIVISYPIAKPLQLLLDKLLGRQQSNLESRAELGMIIAEHISSQDSELDEDEVQIMRGALSLSQKRVRDIMTPIKDVYWLTADTLIDDKKIDEIKDRSHSRIPIFNRQKTKCFGLLLMRDLVDIDFDDEARLISDLTLHPTAIVGSKTALDTMFRKFINSHTHLMPVERDDKIVGIVTVEDLIEEIIGREIEDEGDIEVQQREKERRGRRLLPFPRRR